MICHIHPFTAQYGIYYKQFHIANMTRQLSVQKKHYTLSERIKSAVFFYHDDMNQSSSGLIEKDYLQPQAYSSTESRKNQTESIHFDWAKHVAHASKNGKSADVKLHQDVQDVMSGQIQIRENIFNKKPLSFDLVKSNKMQTYTFKQGKTVQLKTKLGALKTIILTRHDGPRLTTFWLAPKYQYLIVQSRQTRDGKLQAEARIHSLTESKKICVFKS